ncbi:MAG: hypothetical protein R3284_05960, partial [Rubricoccaceae bacterium]|nr:hypothetical protein [Rubricoccaceae bacterium]
MFARIFAFTLLCTLIIAAVWLLNRESTDRWQDNSGAYHALVSWELSRMYPATTFPSTGYMDAVAQAQAMRLAGGDPFPGEWESMGPTNNGGRTLAVVINTERPESVWIGSAGGGLWRSYSEGLNASWERVSTGFPVTSASTVAIAESDTNVVYLGTGEVYRYQDTRGGVVDRPTRGSYGIGILKSEDGGTTWEHVLNWSQNQERGVARIRVNPNDADDVWAATTEGVYRSTDGGDTWTNVHPVVMAMDIVLHPSDPDNAIASHGDQESAGKGIYRTNDGGSSWTQLTNGVQDDFIGKIILDRHPTDPDIVYASIGDGIVSSGGTDTELIRTLDGGDAWSTVTTLDYGSYQGWFAHYVGINPNDPSTVFLAGVQLYRSSDGGFTTDVQASGIHVDHHAIAFHPTDENIIYFANDGGIYRSTDKGLSYDDLNEGYVVLQFYNGTGHSATDPEMSVGGAQDNGSWLWTGSSVWDKVGGGDGSWAAIDPSDDQVQYISSQFLNIRRTTNTWASSSGIAPPGGGATSFIAPYVLAPTMPDRIYAGRSVIYRSNNRGSNWTATNGGSPLDGNAAVAMAVSQTDPDVVYVTTAPDRLPSVAGQRTGVHVTRDGGDTWTDITGTLPDRIFLDVAVHPDDDNIAYVTAGGFGEGHIFRTVDGGATWTDITGILPDVPTMAVAVDFDSQSGDTFVYVGNDVGVFVKPGDSEEWQVFQAGLPTAVMVSDLA